jgi:hypothetical protein
MFLISNADWLLTLWDALWGGVVAFAMFQWGRKYERKQIEKESTTTWSPPTEPTL